MVWKVILVLITRSQQPNTTSGRASLFRLCLLAARVTFSLSPLFRAKGRKGFILMAEEKTGKTSFCGESLKAGGSLL